MLRSLYSGVSGLKTHQTKMDVIGNNIANVNTYGFKASRASFKDIFYQTVKDSSDPTEKIGGGNATQVGYGSTVASIDVLHTRSGYAPTGRAMDVAIEGEGFLIAMDSNDDVMYTRVGQLYFDADGYLVDSNRNYICGYPIKETGANSIEFQKNVPVSGSGLKSKIGIQTGTDNGDKFNDWNFKIVEDDNNPATPAISVSGKTITISAASATTANSALAAAQTYFTTYTKPLKPGDAGYNEGYEKLRQGLPKGVDLSKITIGDSSAPPAAEWPDDPDEAVVLTVTGGVSENTGKPLLDVANGAQRIKKPNTLEDSDDDGYYDSMGAGIADLKSIAIGSDGIITGTTPEGKVVPIGQICLASVPNAEALVLQGNSYYKAVNNTGEIEVEAAGAGQGGKLVSSNLEQSNVDLSNEFADMITTQRGFQANSRIITVGDQMLEELINMKR